MWKPITNNNSYVINEQGQVYSTKTDKILKPYSFYEGGSLYVTLSNKGYSKHFQVARLVLDHFQPSQTKINTFAIHKDLEIENVQNENLNRGSFKRGKTKTVGYFKTEFFATFRYIQAYTKEFGRSPY